MNMPKPRLSIADFLPSIDTIANNLVIYAQAGKQGRRKFYVAMMTLETIASLAIFDESTIIDQEKAQRPLTESRIPAIGNYLAKEDWAFNSITVALESGATFYPLAEGAESVGILVVPRSQHWRIVDGQHRIGGIRKALLQHPERAQETVAIGIYTDCNVDDLRAMFRDMNYFGAKPSTSLSVVFNNRDSDAIIANAVHKGVEVFYSLTELNKNQPADRSDKLFSMNNLYEATKRLIKGYDGDLEEQIQVAIEFWSCVAEDIPYWRQVFSGELSAKECRKNTVCSLGVVMIALGSVGRHLMQEYPKDYLKKLDALRKINWRKTNPDWQILYGPDGKVVKSIAVVNAIADLLWSKLTV